MVAAFRPNVVFVLRDLVGQVLICERADHPGSWQFPQGGIKEGETPKQALRREVLEELGLQEAFYIVKQEFGPFRYTFPPGIHKKAYDGQEQIYFVAETTSDFPKTFCDDFTVGELRAARWIAPAQFDLAWLHPMKWEVYRQFFQHAFGFEPRDSSDMTS